MSTENATTEILEEAGEKIVETVSGLSGLQLVVFGAVCGAAGGAAAYFVTNRYLKTRYEAVAAAEIEEAKKFYSMLNKKDEFADPSTVVTQLHPEEEATDLREAVEALQNYQGIAEEAEEGEDEPPVNIFRASNVDPDFDLDAEMENRTPEDPYVINREEFLQGENDFRQTTITYYAGDGALADENDQEIPLIDQIIGEENLERFGHGSGAGNIVYIRNEKLSTDFEVLLHEGKFAHVVLGLEHSDGGARGRRLMSQPRKFRGDDE